VEEAVAMNDDRIAELAHAVAAAIAAGENEKLISMLEPLSKEENEAVSALSAKVFMDNTIERLGELSVALAAAGNNSELVDAVIDSASFTERRGLVHVALSLNRAEALEAQIALRLDFVPVGGAGPFLFRTNDELSRVVELSMRVTFNDLQPTEQRLSAEGREAVESELEALLSEAEKLGVNQEFKPIQLSTHWTFKLGRKQHVAVVPADHNEYEYSGDYPTVCGQGSGWRSPLPLSGFNHIDCTGCRNALTLGGLLKPRPGGDEEGEA